MWDWMKRAVWPQPKPQEPVKPIVPAKQFSSAVGDGYVDDLGVWHASKRDADYATAERHMILVVRDSLISSTMAYNSYFHETNFRQKIREPDTIRAMAILGECDEGE